MSAPLTGLPSSLDRDGLANVFVFGPGEGEAIAIALPGRGWVIVDGCYVTVDDEEQFPALVAYERWKLDDDPIEAMIWTHPHADHHAGITRFIERHRPRRIGVVCADTPEGGSPLLESKLFESHPLLPADIRLRDVLNQTRTTWESVLGYWEENPDSVWLLRHGTPAIECDGAVVEVLFPTDLAIRAFYSASRPNLGDRLRKRANDLSAVIRVQFGETTILLGGDLPVSRGSTRLPHGWHDIARNWPAAPEHTVGKVPHHGSIEAIDTAIFGSSSGQGVWLVTPYVKSRLPRPDDSIRGGLRKLLVNRSVVRLTADSGILGGQHHGRDVARSAIRDGLAMKTGPLARGTSVVSPATALDCTWGIALDTHGRVQRLFAGTAALAVVETAV